MGKRYVFPSTELAELPESFQRMITEVLIRQLSTSYDQYGYPRGVDGVMEKYRKHRDGFFANSFFHVFDEFMKGDGTRINPKRTLDELFNTDLKLRKMLIKRLREGFVNKDAHFAWTQEFRPSLVREGDLIYDTSLWAVNLAEREGIVGRKVRDKIKEIGYEDPKKLPSDVKKVSANVIKLYDSFEIMSFGAYE